MSRNLSEFAEAIATAAKQVDTARTAEGALDALDELKRLSQCHSEMHMLASMFSLLSDMFVQDGPARVEKFPARN